MIGQPVEMLMPERYREGHQVGSSGGEEEARRVCVYHIALMSKGDSYLDYVICTNTAVLEFSRISILT